MQKHSILQVEQTGTEPPSCDTAERSSNSRACLCEEDQLIGRRGAGIHGHRHVGGIPAMDGHVLHRRFRKLSAVLGKRLCQSHTAVATRKTCDDDTKEAASWSLRELSANELLGVESQVPHGWSGQDLVAHQRISTILGGLHEETLLNLTSV